MRKSAFSLIECLVALGIITVISGIVLSTLGEARKRGHIASNISAMRQLGVAYSLYSEAQGAAPNNPVQLQDGSNLPLELYRSKLDTTPEGLANWRCKILPRNRPPICSDFPRTFVMLSDYDLERAWTQEQYILGQPGAGWLIDPTSFEAPYEATQDWMGTYRRLMFDGSVVTRHYRPLQIVKDGMVRVTAFEPRCFFRDVPQEPIPDEVWKG